MVDLLCYLCILPPHQLYTFRTIVIMNIPLTPLALMCNCFNVLSLQFVLVGEVSLLGDSSVLVMCCIYLSGRILAFLVYPLCVSTVAKHIR